MIRSTIACAGAAMVALLLAGAPQAFATAQSYNIQANGVKEAPGQGDPDGTATGTLTLDNGSGGGTTGTATFSITLSNIDITTLTGHHIHVGAAGTNGSIVLDFGDPDTVRTGSLLSGTVTGLSATQITTIFANPTGFYYNIHNGAFPSGAVRDQLTVVPEPSIGGLVGVSLVGFCSRRRRGV